MPQTPLPSFSLQSSRGLPFFLASQSTALCLEVQSKQRAQPFASATQLALSWAVLARKMSQFENLVETRLLPLYLYVCVPEQTGHSLEDPAFPPHVEWLLLPPPEELALQSAAT